MNKLSILMVLLVSHFYSCNTNRKNYSLENTAWQMDYSMEIHSDTVFNHVPYSLKRIKMFTKNRWSFLGYDFAKKEPSGMGCGTYSLDGEDYTENIEFHYGSSFNGKKFTAKLKVDSLYLYQTGHVDSLVLEERWHRIN
jgi:hypothetical protein